jgi:hypothetical protein
MEKVYPGIPAGRYDICLIGFAIRCASAIAYGFAVAPGKNQLPDLLQISVGVGIDR